MAFFSQENLEAVGGRDKIRLCPRCGLSLEYISEQGYYEGLPCPHQPQFATKSREEGNKRLQGVEI